MNRKAVIFAVLLILLLAPAAAAWSWNPATWVSRAFKIGDAKDIDLNQNAIGNGYAWNITCGGNCTNFNNSALGTNATLPLDASNSSQLKNITKIVIAPASIQTAINSLTAGRTNTETVKAIGNFTISSQITLPNYTMLDLSEAKLYIGNNLNTTAIYSINQSVNIVGGIVDCNGANQADNTKCIHFNGVLDGEISNIQISNSNSHAITIQGSRGRIRILKNTLLDNGYLTAKTDRGIFVIQSGGISDILLDGNIIINQQGYGIGFEQVSRGSITNNIIRDSRTYDGVIIYNSSLITASGNQIYNITDTGIVCELSVECNILGNNLVDYKSQGISFAGSSRSIITGNSLLSTTWSANNTYNDIILQNSGTTNSTYNIVSSNTVTTTGTNKSKYNFRESDASQDYNIIAGNMFRGGQTAKLSMQGTNSINATNIQAT